MTERICPVEPYAFDPEDEMVPEQTCPYCGDFINGGDMVVSLKNHRVAHDTCNEDALASGAYI